MWTVARRRKVTTHRCDAILQCIIHSAWLRVMAYDVARVVDMMLHDTTWLTGVARALSDEPSRRGRRPLPSSKSRGGHATRLRRVGATIVPRPRGGPPDSPRRRGWGPEAGQGQRVPQKSLHTISLPIFSQLRSSRVSASGFILAPGDFRFHTSHVMTEDP